MKEIAVMRKLNHENCIKLHEVIDDEQEKLLYLSKFNFNKFKDIKNKLLHKKSLFKNSFKLSIKII